MSNELEEKLCMKFLQAAAAKVRKVGLARGHRIDDDGRVCMLGAMDCCGVRIADDERKRIEKHVASLLPERPSGPEGGDRYNGGVYPPALSSFHIAWWSNMVAVDAEDVAQKLELAAKTC